MPRIDLPLVGGHAKARALAASASECINLYQETSERSKNKVSLYPTPGLLNLFSSGTGPCRGNGIVFGAHAYIVSGNKLVKIDTSFVATEVGTLTTSNGVVNMTENGTQLFIVDGTDGYIWDGATLTAIADVDFPTCSTCTFIDGYFVVEDQANVGRFMISALYDGTSWDALDYATAEAVPDALRAVASIHNTLFLFGDNSVEPYYNSGDADFPFAPIRNARIEFGVHARFSVVQADNTLYWLSRNAEGTNQIVRLNGYTAVIVSTRELEYELGTFDVTSDCHSYAYQQAGHVFVVFNFANADRTFVYDVGENTWHRRKSYGIDRNRSHGHVHFNGKHIVGDYSTSYFYELSLTTYTETLSLNYIEREFVGGHVHKDGKNIVLHCLEIDVEGGQGLLSGQGSAPLAMLTYSKDGGYTWSSEMTKDLGALGQYRRRVRFHQLGIAEDFLYKIRVTDPIKLVIVGVYLTFSTCDFYSEASNEDKE